MNKKSFYFMVAIHQRNNLYRNPFLWRKKTHPFAACEIARLASCPLRLPLPLPWARGRWKKVQKNTKWLGIADDKSLEKSFYTSYTKLTEIKLMTIGLASPERIRRWAEKTLPNGKVIGKVTNSNTLHHKTFKPQKGGLFCERIFGPLKDFECACGKTKKPLAPLPAKTVDPFSLPLPSFLPGGETAIKTEFKRNYCPTCDVEYTWSVSRRYQLGYIELGEPMTHVWYLKATPSHLSILLDIKKKHLENVVYGAETMTLENSFHAFSFIQLSEQSDLSTAPSSPLPLGLSSPLPAPSSFSLLGETGVFLIKKKDGEEVQRHKNSKSKGLFWLSKTATKRLEWFSKTLHSNHSKNYSFLKRNLATYKSTQRNMIEKAYRRIYSWPRLLARPLLILLSKQRIPNSFKDAKTGIREITQKFPIELYILANIERMVLSQQEKKSIGLTTQRAWKKLYRKAYRKASLKGQQILQKFVSVPPSLLRKNSSRVCFSTDLLGKKREKTNLSLKSSLKALNIQGNRQAELLYLSRMLFQNNFRPSLSISSLNKEMDRLSSLPLSPIASLLLLNQKWRESPQLSVPFKKEQLVNTTANLTPFVPLNSILLSDTTLQVATQITIEKQASVMVKDIESIIHCLTKGLVRTVLPKKVPGPLLSFPPPSPSKKKHLGALKINTPSSYQGRGVVLKHLFLNPFSLKKRGLFATKKREGESKKESKKESKFFTSFRASQEGKGKEVKKRKEKKRDKGEGRKLSLFQNKLNLHPEFVQETVRPRMNFYKLVNNIYSLSHRYRWEAGEAGKKDWASFLEYISAPIFLTDKAIPHYKYRLNPSPLATLVSFQEESLNYKKKIENFNRIVSFCSLKELFSGSSPDSWEFGQKMALDREKKATKRGEKNPEPRVSIRGSGLIKALLTEFNLKDPKLSSRPFPFSMGKGSGGEEPGRDSSESEKTELNKIDKQNRILLYESNKKIYQLKQIFVKETFWDSTVSEKKNTMMKKSLKRDIKELLTQRNLLIRRTKLVRKLFLSTKSGQCPSSMVLSLLPVLPPDLRPIVKMGSGASAKVAATDLNKLYQRVIYRNDSFKLSITGLGNSDHSQFSRALLQIAVDNLIQNNKSGVPAEKDSRGRPLKSLSDILKGKQGRFRQYLLGKRVDYSGRSVIIVGPKLQIHQCGIPKEMALELFLPFLLKRLLNYNLARTVVGAKALLTTNKPLIWELLTEIMRVSPVLLNRAPTLHRLGIQAFIPKLVDGRAILLHPLVCSAFNADFDGDQMAVHVPITVESRAEAWKLMLARNNLLSPATGEPISVPSQDMVLGCYYLTTQCPKGAKKKGFGFYFKNEEDVLKAYDQQKIDLHALIWLQFNGKIEDTSESELPIEIRITKYGSWKEINSKSHITFNSKSEAQKRNGSEEVELDRDGPHRLGFFKLNHYIKTTPGKIVFNKIIKNSMKSGSF